jgi:transcriptional regulator with XRE-family HTH domain
MPTENENFIQAFASNLRRLIDSRSMSTAEVAGRAGIPVGHLEATLEAREELGALEIVRLAVALDVDPQSFFDGLTPGDPNS